MTLTGCWWYPAGRYGPHVCQGCWRKGLCPHWWCHSHPQCEPHSGFATAGWVYPQSPRSVQLDSVKMGHNSTDQPPLEHTQQIHIRLRIIPQWLDNCYPIKSRSELYVCWCHLLWHSTGSTVCSAVSIILYQPWILSCIWIINILLGITVRLLIEAEDFIRFKILVLTYKALHGIAPPYLCDLISSHTPLCSA